MLKNGEKNKLLSRLVRAIPGTVVLVALTICLAFTTSRAWAADASKVGTARLGSSATIGAARSVVLGDLPKATIAELAAHPEPNRPLDGLTDAQYEAKKRAALKRWPIIHTGKEGPAPTKAPTPGFDFAFFAIDQAQGCGGCEPPDMALAVSENFVVQIVNTAIAVYDKRGNLQSGFPKSINAFFGLNSSTYTTDPRAFYDWANHRFVLVMLTESDPFGGDNVGSLLIAASQGHDPRLGWNTYGPAFQIGNTGECPDYPTLGDDANNWASGVTKGGIYVGINQFGPAPNACGGGFIGNYMFLLPKDAIYSGAGFGFQFYQNFTVGGTLVDTVEPYNVTDRAARPSSVLLMNSFNMLFGDPSNGLEVWAITSPFNGPSLSAAFVNTNFNYYFPPRADESGCGGCIETLDKRLSGQVKYHAGSLWGALETGVPNVAGGHILWFEIVPQLDINANVTSALDRREDCFFCGGQGTNGSSFFGDLQPNADNDVAMIYEFSDDNSFPGVALTARRVNFGGLMDSAGNYLAAGQGFYGGARWGDYEATAPDNTIATCPLLWIAGEESEAAGSWGTSIGAVDFCNPFAQ
jgi:hypothetical protein